MPSTARARLENLRRHVGWFQRYPRHLRVFSRYGTPRKLANFALAEGSRILRLTRVPSRPYFYWLDVNNFCNLRCPLCATGRKSIGRPQSMMDFDRFVDLFGRIERWALEVNLYNWGEPLMNRELPRMIEHVANHRVAVSLSTNFSLQVDDDTLEAIVRAGLDYITVSLDGTTQEVYEQYRKRGRLDLVFSNVARLRAIRERLGRRHPQIEWQFIVFRHNEHQIADARRMFREKGFDTIRFAAPALPMEDVYDVEMAERFMPANESFWQYNPKLVRERGYIDEAVCHYMYRAAAINSDGRVTPCCFLHDSKDDFGDLGSQSIDDIINNDRYRSARSLFSRNPEPGLAPTTCDGCPLFRQRNPRESLQRLPAAAAVPAAWTTAKPAAAAPSRRS